MLKHQAKFDANHAQNPSLKDGTNTDGTSASGALGLMPGVAALKVSAVTTDSTTIMPNPALFMRLVSAGTSGAAAGAVTLNTVALTPTAASVGASATWYTSLTTASLKTAIQADMTDGSFSYNEMLSLVQTVQAAGTVTTSEFNDLKTIVLNLNNGVATSSYITYVMNALVNGNAANAQWTGGKASPVTLGNLNVGTTTTQMSELIGKWFLGTDLPSSTVSMSGSSSSMDLAASLEWLASRPR